MAATDLSLPANQQARLDTDRLAQVLENMGWDARRSLLPLIANLARAHMKAHGAKLGTVDSVRNRQGKPVVWIAIGPAGNQVGQAVERMSNEIQRGQVAALGSRAD